ncbi:DUF4097 family beta strand repeat-containing protein [Dictyobacter aurantiacus]|uniref:DUF4097 domain-containing protein n=1 Tax=Dictyobacter aurantiacus TaxID=1936993 RepID=A0A401ZFM8_9CHLR|nr:DUF4097 family beta strand repeat-containing protein [Dictyobacter aurantiacus]GCE05659.1 hypothetical protein KDAU_29880 [Dictyobacter aurantiacus]
MQSQEGDYYQQEQRQAPAPERVVNTDPREQPPPLSAIPPYTYQERRYEDGYASSYAQDDSWFREAEGEKLRPQPEARRGMGGIVSILAILIIGIIIGNTVHIIGGWLIWAALAVIVVGGGALIASNWHVITIPMPVETFPIQEHARLVVNNAFGTVTVRRGEQRQVTIAPTKRISGPWATADNIPLNYDQQGDRITASSEFRWSPLQFGIRRIDLEIMVPENCDLQIKNGAGNIQVQDVSGDLKLRTGSGSIALNALGGQVAAITGSGTINADDLRGRIELRTGSGTITTNHLQGSLALKTGSGSIEGTDLNGQVEMTTGSGRIEIGPSNLNGGSSFKTGSGSISFVGSLDPLGSLSFKTGSGSISLMLPSDSSFSLSASTGSGGVHNEFGGSEIGSGPRARLIAKTGSGRITIQRTP